MNIVLEVGLNTEGKRGADVYYQGLLDGLGRKGPKHRFRVFAYFYRDFEEKRKALPVVSGDNFEVCAKRWPERIVNFLEWSAGLPAIDRLFVRGAGADVYHSLSGRLPRLSRAKSVVTIYDLLYELAHERAVKEGRNPGPLRTTTGEAAGRADRIITISRSTRDDLVRFYGIDPAKVTVILLGVDQEAFHPVADPAVLAAARSRHALPGKYWLFMGPFEPRRNAESAMKAIAQLRAEGVGRDHCLVFVGRKNGHLESLMHLSESLGLRGDARCLGYLPREDLTLVYQQAFAFIHPETYDGFSLPILEAMASGTPVVTSTSSALPEIVGDSALMAAPDDIAALARALKRLLTEPSLRAELREKALARAKTFTWDAVAEQTLGVYESLNQAGRSN